MRKFQKIPDSTSDEVLLSSVYGLPFLPIGDVLDALTELKIWILYPDVGAAENAAAAAWGRISLGGGGVSAAGTNFFGNIVIVPLTDIL